MFQELKGPLTSLERHLWSHCVPQPLPEASAGKWCGKGVKEPLSALPLQGGVRPRGKGYCGLPRNGLVPVAAGICLGLLRGGGLRSKKSPTVQDERLFVMWECRAEGVGCWKAAPVKPHLLSSLCFRPAGGCSGLGTLQRAMLASFLAFSVPPPKRNCPKPNTECYWELRY